MPDPQAEATFAASRLSWSWPEGSEHARLRRLYTDPQRRRELAENGRRAQQRNGWDVQRQAYLAPYRVTAGMRTTA